MAAGLKSKVSASTSVLIVAAILLVLNLISVNVFSRADLTDNDIYSLSDASKELMRGLADRVVVKCFFTEDLPPPYNQNARYLKDQLAEYRAYSGGRLQFEFIDPALAGKEEEAQSYRIPPVQVNAYESDRLEIKKVYMGLVFLHEDKNEVLPVVQTTAGLEYEITRAIKKVTQTATPRIGYVTGHGEPEPNQNLKAVSQALSREYDLEPINLAQLQQIPADMSAVLVVSPKNRFSDWELYLLDRYIAGGGRVGMFLDRYDCDLQNNSATEIASGLEDLIRTYGVSVNSDLVLDARSSRITVQQQSGYFKVQNMIEFRFFPLITGFDEENIIVKGLDALTFTFVSSLDTTVAVPPAVERDVFARTSEMAATESGQIDLNPFRRFTRADFDRKYVPLAATLRGEFPSYFDGKPVPQYTGPDSTFNPSALPAVAKSPDTRMVVVGDGDFVDDRNLGSEASLVFFMNAIDWLSQDEGLISIRSKRINVRPLAEVSDGTKAVTKYLNILGMPLLVIVFGVANWQIRRSAKKRHV
jgi:gliding-associated putative ABC transporter substrate-binding component GldG